MWFDPKPLAMLVPDAFELPLGIIDRAIEPDEADLGMRLPSGVGCDIERVGARGGRMKAGERAIGGF